MSEQLKKFGLVTKIIISILILCSLYFFYWLPSGFLESALFCKSSQVIRKEFGTRNMIISSSLDFAETVKVGTILERLSSGTNSEYLSTDLTIGLMIGDENIHMNTKTSKTRWYYEEGKIDSIGWLRFFKGMLSHTHHSTLNIGHSGYFTETLDLLLLKNDLEQRKLVTKDLRNFLEEVLSTPQSDFDDRRHLVVVNKVLFSMSKTVDVESNPKTSSSVEDGAGNKISHEASRTNKKGIVIPYPVAISFEVKDLFINIHNENEGEHCFLSTYRKNDSVPLEIHSAGATFVKASTKKDYGKVLKTVICAQALLVLFVMFGICTYSEWPITEPSDYDKVAEDINRQFVEMTRCTALTVCPNLASARLIEVGTVMQRTSAEGVKSYSFTEPKTHIRKMIREKFSLKPTESDGLLYAIPSNKGHVGVKKKAKKYATKMYNLIWGIKPTTCFTRSLDDADADALERRKLDTRIAKELIEEGFSRCGTSLCLVMKVLFANNLDAVVESQPKVNANNDSIARPKPILKMCSKSGEDVSIALSYEIKELLINIADGSFKVTKEGGFVIHQTEKSATKELRSSVPICQDTDTDVRDTSVQLQLPAEVTEVDKPEGKAQRQAGEQRDEIAQEALPQETCSPSDDHARKQRDEIAQEAQPQETCRPSHDQAGEQRDEIDQEALPQETCSPSHDQVRNLDIGENVENPDTDFDVGQDGVDNDDSAEEDTDSKEGDDSDDDDSEFDDDADNIHVSTI